MFKKLSLVLACLLLFSLTPIQAQDMCDKYFNKYQVCVEQRDAGWQMDYEECKAYTEPPCSFAGCYWDGAKGICTVNSMLLMDGSLDGKVNSTDLAIYKKEFGKINYPTAPTIPGYMGAPVEKTGQTTCYDGDGNLIDCAGTNQDGDWQKGVPWANPRFTIIYHYWFIAFNRPCDPPTVECEDPPDPNNDVVFDNLTGLYWLRDANYFGTTKTWEVAVTSASNIPFFEPSVEECWRLPNVKELQSLIDFSQNSPALPSGHSFINVQSANYWSSTTSDAYNSFAWHVDMWVGGATHDHKHNPNSYVWPVRGGQ